jgi:hypothetical protein
MGKNKNLIKTAICEVVDLCCNGTLAVQIVLWLTKQTSKPFWLVD